MRASSQKRERSGSVSGSNILAHRYLTRSPEARVCGRGLEFALHGMAFYNFAFIREADDSRYDAIHGR